MPATTSPITRGCEMRAAAAPNSRATSITIATAMRNTATRCPNDSRAFVPVNFSPAAVTLLRVRSTAAAWVVGGGGAGGGGGPAAAPAALAGDVPRDEPRLVVVGDLAEVGATGG